MKRLRVGDLVQVISGKEKGKQGRVSKILAEDDKVVVEGLNKVTRHQRPTPRNQQGGKIEKEAPLQASKVMLVDPTTGKPSRVKVKDVDGEERRRDYGRLSHGGQEGRQGQGQGRKAREGRQTGGSEAGCCCSW
jgi:large subunit ribosomal protein L24